jgi:hypothetical protein
VPLNLFLSQLTIATSQVTFASEQSHNKRIDRNAESISLGSNSREFSGASL